jgi:hypothetical protein
MVSPRVIYSACTFSSKVISLHCDYFSIISNLTIISSGFDFELGKLGDKMEICTDTINYN